MSDIAPDDVDRLIARIRTEEGVRAKPYKDSVGKLTIGVGRNLDDVGLSNDEIDYLLRNDLGRAEHGLNAALPWWTGLTPVRQSVLIDMAFNMGLATLLTFKTTLEAMRTGDFKAAAAGMRQSKWAKQTGARAQALAKMMETDSYGV